MFVHHPLLNLPIHKRSRDRYYQDHDEWMEQQKPRVEKAWRSTFEELPAHIRIHWKDRWYWPPWYFNDVVGFLRIGTSTEDSLGADLFLKRRYFQLDSPERLYRKEEGVKDREQVLYFWSLAGRGVDPARNETYLAAVEMLLPEATTTVRQFGRGTLEATICLPDYDLACIDLAQADQRMRQSMVES